MKEKLRTLVKCLAQKHYSTDTILRAILLPTQTENTEEVMDQLIQIIQQTKTEQELLEKLDQMR